MNLLFAIAIAGAIPDQITSVAIHDDDMITQIHVEAVFQEHGYKYNNSGVEDWGNMAFFVTDPPQDLFAILSTEAPSDRFSLYSYQKRDFSDRIRKEEWTALQPDQLGGKKWSPFHVADVLHLVNLKAGQVKSITYFPRPYDGLDRRCHVGYEIAVSGTGSFATFKHPDRVLVATSPSGWTIRCQAYDHDGKQKIIRRSFRMGMAPLRE